MFDGCAVFAFQLFERGQPVFYLVETSWIGLQLVYVAPERVRSLLQGDRRGLELRQDLLRALINAGEFLQPLGDRAHLRGGAVGIFVQRGISAAGQFLQPDHVAQHAALVFELGVLTGLGRDRLDFLALERPQIRQSKLFLRVAVELVTLNRCSLPSLECL